MVFSERHKEHLQSKELKVSLPRKLRGRLYSCMEKYDYEDHRTDETNWHYTVSVLHEDLLSILSSTYGEEKPKAYINDVLQPIEKIKDFEEKVIQELLFEDEHNLQQTFVQRLEAAASLILQDNERAKKLKVYRELIFSNKLSSEKFEEVNKLEFAVGHILDSEKHEDFIANLMLRESLVTIFLNDMIEHGQQFDIIKSQLKDSVERLVQGSSLVAANLEFAQLLWYLFPTSWQTFLRCFGLDEIIFNN